MYTVASVDAVFMTGITAGIETDDVHFETFAKAETMCSSVQSRPFVARL